MSFLTTMRERVSGLYLRNDEPTARRARTRRLPWWIDAIALMLLAVGIAFAFWPAYGGYWIWVTVLVSTAIGIGVGWLSRWRYMNAIMTFLTGVAAWFIFGGFLAMPTDSIAYFIPTGRVLAGLATGPVTGWYDMLTIAPPLGTTWNVMTVPMFVGMVTGIVGFSIARRSKQPALAWLPSAAGLITGFILGTDESSYPVWIAICFGTTVVLWTTAQRSISRTSLIGSPVRRRLPNGLLAAGVLVLCGGLVAAAAPLVEPNRTRLNAREFVEQPLQVHEFSSPLQGYRANFSLHEKDVLFRVEGAPQGAVLRIASMDQYDGMTYNVSSDSNEEGADFVRIGARINDPAMGDLHTLTVTMEDYSDVWLPVTGVPQDVTFGGDRAIEMTDAFYYSTANSTGVVPVSSQGATYQLETVMTPVPHQDDILYAQAGSVEQPDLAQVPDRVRDYATLWSGSAGSAGEAATNLADHLSSTGWFSHGVEATDTPSLPGHNFARISELLYDPEQMVGDEEQYSVTLALMLRALGIPARVVYGYEIPANGEVRGEHATAWTEANLEGLGWVAFNPTPDEDRVLEQFTETENPETRPHVENPPPPPDRPEAPPPDDPLPVDQKDEDKNRVNLAEIAQITVMVALPVVLLFGPIVLIVGLKRRRRSHRMNDSNIANRISGGWAELLDQARDLGKRISPAATRTEQASDLARTYDELGRDIDTNMLARQADASTFAPDPVSEQQATNYWSGVDDAIAKMRESVGRRRALLSRLSTRSFRIFRR